MARKRFRLRSERDERGSAAVEFALVLPLLLALILGILTFGLGYNNVLGLADGVHEGSRFGATLANTATWGATVQQQTIDLSYLNQSGHTAVVTTSMVCAQLLKTPSTVLQASAPCSQSGSYPPNPAGVAAGVCLVKVWGKMPIDITMFPLPSQTFQIVRQSVSLYERACP